MNRVEFLKRTGLAGLASFLPLGATQAAARAFKQAAAEGDVGRATICSLIPSETEGPYPLNLSGNAAMFRQDIREQQVGVQLDVTLKIFGIQNCAVVPNARVDVWHCNAYGYYSGYQNTSHQGQQNHVGETWCRGIQMTDANGEVHFTTVFPGWYPSRLTHIHFQVYLNSLLKVTSQFTFPESLKNQIYTSNAPYSTWGADPLTPGGDMVFADGYALQMATLTPNATTGGYDAYLEVGINTSGVPLGLLQAEPETGRQFTLGQNFPNPCGAETSVPFMLANGSDVVLALYDLSGRQVAEIVRNGLAAGDHQLPLRFAALGIASGDYVYQLHVTNANGTYQQCKRITALR